MSAALVPAAAAADAKTADTKADAAEAGAAMERAKRLAANPMRVILEASKVKRKIVAEPDAVLPANQATAASPASTPAALPPPLSTVALTTQSAAAAVVRSDDVPAQASPPVARPSPMRTLSASPIATPMAETVPAMVSTDRLAVPDAMRTAAVPTADTARLTTPRLVEMIEPVIPARLLDELGRTVEFTADLTIRPDGTVAQVQVVPPANRALSRYVVAAMERWRFAPLPGEQLHRVQLVFNGQ